VSGLSPLRVLPPVAEPARLRRGGATLVAPQHRVYYTESGTAALALALSIVGEAARKIDVQRNEVLLPAYGCPDVVSAILYAGLRPRLVDLAPLSSFPSSENWLRAMTPQTLVVLTVGFLGMRDAFALNRTHHEAGSVHIEDCCQVHPSVVTHTVDRGFVYSFGRGKPVSLLHGGATVLPDSVLNAATAPDLKRSARSLPALLGRAFAYNVLRLPHIYAWVRRAPGLALGVTRYKPLGQIHAMHSAMVGRIRVSTGDKAARLRRQHRIRDMLRSVSTKGTIVDLWNRDGTGEEWLLRYPILLASREMRQRALDALDRAGLGASPFYGQALPDLPDVPEIVRSSPNQPNAQAFAERLLTLPLHSAVRDRDIDAMGTILSRSLQ
jgi:dTDP-4-amino-4,6-dideoxygalactose transaminase